MYRKLLTLIVLALASIGLWAQTQSKVHEDFEARRQSIAKKEYFEIFDKTPLDPQTRDALESLYAYMPLVDLVTYPGEYFLGCVDASLKARELVPWGKEVPQREFLHFVLPVRVNNEPLDEHRALFLEELLPRVQGLSAKDAILEINHWCHEKASYQPSDSRTHSPLATVSTAIGRCGEESTFAVAALRALCIPARQVYTPRWAHTDDNHAWVEAWADGRWWFFGACEPEAVLNLGWFNEPASRGMLMNTSVFGRYDGPEEVLAEKDGVTTINVTANYAAVDTIRVKVSDRHGRPLEGLNVSLRLYNYAEYYPLVSRKTDSRGEVSLVAGLGDLLLWVSDGEEFCFQKATVGRDKIARVTWTGKSLSGDYDFDLVPPRASNSKVTVSAEQSGINNQRKSQEDIIRSAYSLGAFFDASKIDSFAPLVGLEPQRLSRILVGAKANWQNIYQWLRRLPADRRELGLVLLENLSAKDLTDVRAEVLSDAVSGTEGDLKDENFRKYVLSQRISNEELSPFRSYFRQKFSPEQISSFRSDPQSWERQVMETIETSQTWHPATFHIIPGAVGEFGGADKTSRDIYFVSGARSFGIPARIDPVTSKPQWLRSDGVWCDAFVKASSSGKETAKTGATKRPTLLLTYSGEGPANPTYYSHFSISKIEGGVPHQLEFDEGASLEAIFASGPREFDPGCYMLTTGQRLSDGSVLAHNTIFTLKTGQRLSLPLKFRSDASRLSVIGALDAETLYYDLVHKTEKSILSTTGRGFYVLGIVRPGHEPSTHALKDIEAVKEQIEKWGGKMLLLFETKENAQKYSLNSVHLPSNATLGVDSEGRISAQILQSLSKDVSATELPIFVIADSFNRIVYFSNGYTIGLGSRLAELLGKL